MAASNDNGDFNYHMGYYYPANLDENVVKAMPDFPFKGGDILLAGFQKSGPNWMVRILMAMYDDWGVCKVDDLRDPGVLNWLALTPQLRTVRQQWKTAFEDQMTSMPSPRLLRTHYPLEVLCPEKHLTEKRLEIIYVSRNPKDVCVSWYHHTQTFVDGSWAALDWKESVTNFVEGRVNNGPWLDHVTSWHKLGRSDDVLHVKYEDMKRNPKEVIGKMANFLNRPLTKPKIQHVAESTTFEVMKSNDKTIPLTKEVKNFFRKGTIGDWKNYFTVAQNEHFDRVITEKLKERDIDFIYE
ncbi:sulfotransferase 1B1-like [Glandiceps talaboti]